MNLVIVSGLSGSGKTIALQALEDMNYYCIDNLPAALLLNFSNHLLSQTDSDYTDAAVSIDSRNRGSLESLPKQLKEIESQGLNCMTLYLDADESVLINRYSETRRKHPLTDEHTSLLEGIRIEKKLLAPLAMNATKVIDTTYTTPHELRGLVRDFSGVIATDRMSLLIESFGFKHGTPQDADFVFDVRCLPNPYWEPDLKPLTGLDDAVVDYLNSRSRVREMIDQIGDFIDNWLPGFQSEHRSYITIAIGCTGGQHRSVYIATELAKRFARHSLNIQMRHRELS